MKKITIKFKSGKTQTVTAKSHYEKDGKLFIKVNENDDTFIQFDKSQFDNYLIENCDSADNKNVLLG